MSRQSKPRGRPRSAVPSYRLHRASGQAVCTIDGKDVYLGRHGSEESRKRYGDILAKAAAHLPIEPQRGNSLPIPTGPTIDELSVKFIEFADGHYLKNGRPTSEIDIIKAAIAPLHQFWGDVPASGFGPKLLKAYRDKLVARGITRNTINALVGRVRRIFRHAVSEELIPSEIYQKLAAVEGLRRGRTEARESEAVRPVSDVAVAATLPFVSETVSAMIRLQRLTGMRPGEVCSLRLEEIDTSGPIWLFKPSDHKLSHHGRDRVVAIGPRGQAILNGRRGLRLAGPVFPGGANRQSKQPITTAAYRRAICRGCEVAFGMPSDLEPADQIAWRERYAWHPNQLRHSFATELRRTPGMSLDAVAACLGHTQLSTSQIYAELDTATAAEAAARIG